MEKQNNDVWIVLLISFPKFCHKFFKSSNGDFLMMNLILINIIQEYIKSSTGTAHKELYGNITRVFSMTI